MGKQEGKKGNVKEESAAAGKTKKSATRRRESDVKLGRTEPESLGARRINREQ